MKHIHFIGIGGIGVSALARYYLSKGHKITGSDLVSSELTEAFKKKGVKICIGKHKAKNISKDIDLVVYSPAVKQDNPEQKKAKKLGIKVQSYPQALGELTKKYFTIAVAGSHGKSTTAAMLSLLLTRAGLDPTVIVGTKLKEFGDSNCRVGKSKYLIIEADEHFASFLNYWPKIIVLTILESDHLDFYKNLDNLLKSFKKFISHLPENGILIAIKDDKNISKILKNKELKYKIIYYSLKDKEAKKIKKILKVPGDFNVLNALAALNVARALKIPNKTSFKSLSQYKSSWRRFDITKILYPKPYTLIDDYGHHPTQVRVTLKAAREKFPKKEIWCIYQPHQYQRTHYLFNEFVKAFKKAPVNKLIITDIYSVVGRETKEIKRKVNSKKLVKAVNKSSVIYLTKEKLEKFLKQNIKKGQVVIIMGAGDIYNLSLKLKIKS
ncbi:MAG: UDP-N-acetylmuramate--L-alanine ligase [Candidatus Nealsonbacteria bacterium]|nr:MAG: UDP-N-acetylmuramate--L-alanine ligase [Candidatus Nealsonbacteria bacterium]